MKALTEEFLYELYGTAIENEKIAALVAIHMESSYLPNRHFQQIQNAFRSHWTQHKEPPTYGVITQALSDEPRCISMIEEFRDCASDNVEATMDMLERYIKDVKRKQTLEQCIRLHDNGESSKAEAVITEYSEWVNEFSLQPSGLIDIFGTFSSRYEKNKRLSEDENTKKKPVYRFYIDELDTLNGERNLRGQLSMWMASSGVGKSHVARHIGLSASVDDGLDVLHIQCEGTLREVSDAYSASLAGYNAMFYEQAKIPDDKFQQAVDKIKGISGTLMVKSFSKFGKNVSTMDVKNAADEFLDAVGKYPDVIIVDSMDLLTDFRKTRKTKEELRHVRLNVAQDLKNLAMDLDSWVVVTYQSTIEDEDFLNDENKKLTRYHLSEAKGIIRPLTHLITLNQTEAEKDDKKMRLFIDKSRFFASGSGTVCIKTDYDRGQFYDSEATLRLMAY